MPIIVHFFETNVLNYQSDLISVSNIKLDLLKKKGLDNLPHKININLNGKYLQDDEELNPNELIILRASLSGNVLGGKGGFGAMLRAQAKVKGKKITDFGACRDLSGRRLRHVNDEILLNKWKEAKEKGEEFDPYEQTKTGIDLWYLGAPSYIDKTYKPQKKKEYMKSRSKTAICKDWELARANGRNPPAGAPRYWGCPRGPRCDYAHGEEDLQAFKKEELKEDRINEMKTKENSEKTAYLRHIDEDNDDYMKELISVGIQMSKRPPEEDVLNKSKYPSSSYSFDFPNSEEVVEVGESGQKGQKEGDSSDRRGKKPLAAEVIVSDQESDTEEEDAIPDSVNECEWMCILSGSLSIKSTGSIEGFGIFSTAFVPDCELKYGKYYYEAHLISSGIMQLGWASNKFYLSSDSTDGVGDDKYSYSYDGSRQKKWNESDGVYGMVWSAGDTVGCRIDLSKGFADISYYLNGQLLGSAFLVDRKIPDKSSVHVNAGDGDDLFFYPAVSIEQGEKLELNIGQFPFKYPLESEGVKSVLSGKTSASEQYQNESKQGINPEKDKNSLSGGVTKEYPDICLESAEYNSSGSLEKLGLEHLKYELNRRGLKTGGTLQERAARLFAVKGLSDGQIDNKLKQKR